MQSCKCHCLNLFFPSRRTGAGNFIADTTLQITLFFKIRELFAILLSSINMHLRSEWCVCVWKVGAKAPLKSVSSCIVSYIVCTCVLQTGDSLPTVNGWECKRVYKPPNILCKIWKTGCIAFTRSSRGSETSRRIGILAPEGFSE